MIEVFRNSEFAKVGQYRGILEAEGIRTFIRNESVSGTEVLIPTFYPALCILDEADHDRALGIIKSYEEAPPVDPAGEIVCKECGEASPGTFGNCWNCGSALPEAAV